MPPHAPLPQARPGFRPLKALPALLALIAAAQPAAWSMDRPDGGAGAGVGTASPAAPVFKPGGVLRVTGKRPKTLDGLASLGGEGVFILRDGKACTRCKSDQEKRVCRHHRPATLCYHFLEGDDSEREYQVKAIAQLHHDSAGLVPGPGNTLLVGNLDGRLTRIYLSGKAPNWGVARTEPLLDADQRKELDLPEERFHSFAVGPGGEIVLGFERSVALLPGNLDFACKDTVKWLFRKKPDSRIDPGTGMVVAVDSKGVVLVVDPTAKAAYWYAPSIQEDKKDKGCAAIMNSWGVAGFVPADAVAYGRNLIVAGTGGGGEDALIALSPQGPAQLYAAQRLELKVKPGEAFAATPQGHLILWNPDEKCVEFRVNEVTLEKARRTRDADRKRQAAADEVLAQLEQEEELAAERRKQAMEEAQRKAREGAGPGLDWSGAEAEAEGMEWKDLAEEVPEEALVAWIGQRARPESKRSGASPAAPAGGAGKGWWSRALSKDCFRIPSGSVCRRGIARKLDTLTGDVKTRLKRPAGASIAELLKLPDLGAAKVTKDSLPAEAGRFALGEAAVEEAVRWMLRHAERANHPFEVGQWRLKPGTAPAFSFGMYEYRRRLGVTLEIDDLECFAGFIDGKAGGLAAELAATGGRTGVHVSHDGKVRFAYGLTVVLADEPCRIVAVRPGGCLRATHVESKAVVERPGESAPARDGKAGTEIGPGLGLTPLPAPASGAPKAASPLADLQQARRFPASGQLRADLSAWSSGFAAGEGFSAECKAGIEHLAACAPAGGMSLADLDQTVDHLAAKLKAGASPMGLAQFALDAGAVRRAVQWMLENAGQANRPAEVAQWLRRSHTAPSFSFGLYEYGLPGATLEIANLQTFAGFQDGFPGGEAGIATQLARSGGCTGIHLTADGRLRYAYGLTVGLGPDLRSILFIRPGGAHIVETLSAPKAESKRNPKAEAFKPAGS